MHVKTVDAEEEAIGPDGKHSSHVANDGTREDASGKLPFRERLQRETVRPLGQYGGVRIAVEVTCFGKTGVEMEALAGAMGAALTTVDMCKSVDRGMVVGGMRVVRKEGGRSGLWAEPGWA